MDRRIKKMKGGVIIKVKHLLILGSGVEVAAEKLPTLTRFIAKYDIMGTKDVNIITDTLKSKEVVSGGCTTYDFSNMIK